VLIIDAGVITPYQDAGSRAVLDIATVLSGIGFEVEFLLENSPGFKEKLSASEASHFWISRPSLFNRVHPDINKRAKTIYLAHDLHTLRLKREFEVTGKFSPERIKAMELLEKRAFARSTLALLPTASEAKYVREAWGVPQVEHINYFYFDVRPPLNRSGQQLVFVGGQQHNPNSDGIFWFITRVFPELRRVYPNLTLKVVGSWSSDFIVAASSMGISFTGVMGDQELSDVLDASIAGLAPLRFGAGIKRKVLDYLNHGLPVVSTSIGMEGIESASGDVPGTLVANSAEDWVRSLTQLLTNPQLQKSLGQEGASFIASHYSKDALGTKLLKLLAEI
jgi:hypothetical protein